MKILWLSHLIPYPPKGGVLQRAYHLIHELSKYHTIDLLAFNQEDLIAPFFSSISEGMTEARRELGRFCNNIDFVPIDCDKSRYGKHFLALKSLVTRDPYTINWLKSKEFSEKLASFLMREDYDLIHFDTISLIPYLEQISSIPVVLDHHNIESHMLLRRSDNENQMFKRWYYRQEGKRLEKIEKTVCPLFNLNITCSKVDRDRLIELTGRNNIEEVPNGVDTDYFQHDESIRQQSSLIFAGTLSWYPNIEAVRFIAYEIWPRIKEIFTGMTIDIVGANPPEDIRQLAQKDEGFRVHGFVDDVRPYIDRAFAYICPIKDGGGTKLKILDALAMQKAIIAHPIACEGIQVEEDRNVLFAQTADDYIQQIQRLMDDENTRIQLGMNARQLVDDIYSYQIIGKDVSALYESMLNSADASDTNR